MTNKIKISAELIQKFSSICTKYGIKEFNVNFLSEKSCKINRSYRTMSMCGWGNDKDNIANFFFMLGWMDVIRTTNDALQKGWELIVENGFKESFVDEDEYSSIAYPLK